MSNDTPLRCAKALTLRGVLLSGGPAHAADYSVDFGVETSAGKDASSLACKLEETCGADLNSLGLRITFFVLRSSPDRVTVHLYGRDVTCCYFAYAADKVAIDPRRPV